MWIFHLCCQSDRAGCSSLSRDRFDGVDRRSWTLAHLSAHQGTAQPGSRPKPSFDALTPPQGSSSIVNDCGPGGMTPLMVASMSPAAEAAHCAVVDGQAVGFSAQLKSSTIIPELISEGASTEDCTDFSGVFCYIFSSAG